MKEQLTRADVTPEVKAGVAELLACMTIAQVTREKVDAVQREILLDIALYDDQDARHRNREPERIYDPSRTWVSEDEEALDRYYTAVDAALRAKGLKNGDLDRDHCPALVAEHNQRKAEWSLLDAAAQMMEMDFDGKELNHRLLCRVGLDGRQEFLDLLVKIVVNF